MNEINVIAPKNSLFRIIVYDWGNKWCFDDAVKGLSAEPFVLGASEMIDDVIQKKFGEVDRACEYGITFSAAPFPRYDASLTRQKEEFGGFWYNLNGTPLEGWLCPATKLYFGEHPESIYVDIENLGPNEDIIEFTPEWEEIQVA